MANARLATFNLYHFAEPGIFWHERGENDDRTYTEEEWSAKRVWVTQLLAQMDADVVAFQEVVSPDALRELCATAGYPHFYCLTEARFDKDDPAIYINGTVSIASRFEAKSAHEVKEFKTIVAETLLDKNAMYSRRPLRCVFDLPGLADTVVYSAHFKSQGAFFNDEIVDDIDDWDLKMRRFFIERMYADVDQVSKRAAEAGAMYLQIREDLKDRLERPVVLLGDLNEAPSSHTISILTQADRIFSVGSIRRGDIPQEQRFRKYIHRIYDAYPLVTNASAARPPTHASGHGASVLDYAIVSNGLNADNPRRTGTVVNHSVYDDHFDAQISRSLTSDHAPVLIEIEPRPAPSASTVIGL